MISLHNLRYLTSTKASVSSLARSMTGKSRAASTVTPTVPGIFSTCLGNFPSSHFHTDPAPLNMAAVTVVTGTIIHVRRDSTTEYMKDVAVCFDANDNGKVMGACFMKSLCALVA